MKLRFLVLSLFLMSVTTFSYSANEWQNALGTDIPEGSSNLSDLDTNLFNYAFDPLERLLASYRHGINLVYTSATTVTAEVEDGATAGEITLSNSGGTIRKFRRNTSDLAITFSNRSDAIR